MYLTAHGLSFNITPTGRFFGKIPEPDDVKKDIELVKNSGFDGYEMWVEKLTSYLPQGSKEELRKLVEDAGIKVPAFCFVGDFPDMGIHTAEPESARQIFEVLSAIGCDVGIYVVDPHEGMSRDEAMQKACQKVQGVADIAKDYGTKLAIEFIYTIHYMKSLADAIELMERSGRDNVGISLDTFHFYIGASNLEDIARIPKGKLYGVHANSCPDLPKDQMTDKDRVPPGKGVLPYAEILDACKAQGYDAHLSVEILHDDYWKMSPEDGLESIYRESKDALAAWC
jgi:2-keto-myo-inositol isomerase